MIKHGHCRHGTVSVEYRAWVHMKDRCLNPRCKIYPYYGGRGIKVCRRWLNSYPNFYSDMGNRPNGMTLERKNNRLGYSPANCAWAPMVEQGNNKRSNRLLTYNGKTRTVRQWEKEIGSCEGFIAARIWRGWSPKRAIETPRSEIHVRK